MFNGIIVQTCAHARAHSRRLRYKGARLHARKSTVTRSQRTDRKVAGVISRIRPTRWGGGEGRSGGGRGLMHEPPTLNPPHSKTHTRAYFISNPPPRHPPPGCLRYRHPNSLKITFSYYPDNGGQEYNFSSRSGKKKKKKLRRGGIGQRMVPLAVFPCCGLGKAN